MKILVKAELHNTSFSLKLESTNILATKEIYTMKEMSKNSKIHQFLHTLHCLPFSHVFWIGKLLLMSYLLYCHRAKNSLDFKLLTLRKSVQIRSFFWSVFSHIRTRKNSVLGHFWRREDWDLSWYFLSFKIIWRTSLICYRIFLKAYMIRGIFMTLSNICNVKRNRNLNTSLLKMV